MITQKDIQAMTPGELAGALLRGADGNDMRAGVEILTTTMRGDLLENEAVRAHATLWDQREGTLRMRWSSLASAVVDDPTLSETGFGLVRLACALACGSPMPDMNRLYQRLDRPNREVVLAATAIALGLDMPKREPVAPAGARPPALAAPAPPRGVKRWTERRRPRPATT